MIIAANGAFCQQLSRKMPGLATPKLPLIPYQSIYYHSRQLSVVPGNYYCTQLGFFCRTELKLEAATKIPFKFRLGSLQYNDWLEGKKNAGILPVR